eukprot:gene40671-46314_t
MGNRISVDNGDVLCDGSRLGHIEEVDGNPHAMRVVIADGCGAISKVDQLIKCLAFVTEEPPGFKEG